jgi:hypothetical protein
MSMTEEMFGKLYEALPGLGETGTKDVEGDDTQVTEDDLLDDGEEDAAPDEKDIDTAGTGGVGSDSGDRADNAPDGDEVLEGMDHKSLYGKSKMLAAIQRGRGKRKYLPSKRKSCAECGDGPCECKKNLSAEDVTSADGQLAETTDASNPQGLHQKALEMHEKPIAAEAAQHLKVLSESPHMDQEARFKSYHFHKRLEELSGMGQKELPPTDGTVDPSTDPNVPTGQMSLNPNHRKDWHGDYDEPNTLGIGEDQPQTMHHHRKSCHSASGFLKALAYSKDFGDPHRMEALQHHKALDEISKEEQPEETPTEVMDDADSEVNVTEPGEMGEKALNALKAMVLEQEKTIARLTGSVRTIGSKL